MLAIFFSITVIGWGLCALIFSIMRMLTKDK